MTRKLKTITVKAKSTESVSSEFTEYEYPLINKYFNEGWGLISTHFNTTEQNVGFLFITFIIYKDE